MPARHIVTGQKVSQQKLARAKAMRSQMTEAEARLWERLRTDRLEGWHFHRQQVVAGFIVDFYCHAAGLVVEVDGPIHDRQIEYDALREQALTAHGLRILRFKNAEVLNNLPAVLESILRACMAGGEAQYA